MRIKDDFTVFPREMASGKVIWYYQNYDDEGRRLGPKAVLTFAEYAQGFW
jgi:hypothetical protein